MLMNELRHYNGRTGMGAVMGSKNVRAIAVKGSRKYGELAHDAAALGEIGRRLSKTIPEHPQGWDLRTKGTPGLTDGLNAAGILPTRNFREGSFEQVRAHRLGRLRGHQSGPATCYACAVRCKPETAFEGQRYRVTDTYDGPEYEAIAGFGSNCAIFDMELVARANELCNELGLDVISTAGTVAFVMECVEHGLLGPDELQGVDLRFGNGEALLEALPLIADRRGVGELLALGSRRIAERLGGDALSFAMQVKGLELAMHEPRGKTGVALGYATNEAGADHLVGFHDPIFVNPGIRAVQGRDPPGGIEPADVFSLGDAKVGNWYTGERWNSAEKVLGLCFFGPAPRSFIQVGDVVDAVRAATGWDVTVDELLEIGERAVDIGPRVQQPRGLRARRRPAAGPPPHSTRGRATHRTVHRSRRVRGRDHRPVRAQGRDPITGAPSAERLHALGLNWTIETPAGAG